MKNLFLKRAGRYLLAAGCMLVVNAKAQNFEWAKKGGGTSNDQAMGVSQDMDGNVYTTGNFSGTATFGTFSLTSSGTQDIFITKQDKSGTFLWAVKAGGASSWDQAQSIATDDLGNSYVTGYFSSTATFGTTTLTSAGNEDVFLAKYDKNGTLSWAVSMGGTSTDEGNSVAVSGSGNHAQVVVTGFFFGTGTFGTTALTASGGQDIFLAEFDGLGTFNWAKQFGGTSTDIGAAVTEDAGSNIYLTGSFTGAVTFGTTALTSSASSLDIFVAKMNSAGTMTWVKQGSGTGADYSRAIAVDNASNVYVSGSYSSGTLTFGSYSVTLNTWGYDAFAVKYNSSGSEQWAKRVAASYGGLAEATGLAPDDAGAYVYITGNYRQDGYFQTGTVSNSSGVDLFVTRYSAAGIETLLRTAGGSGDDYSTGISINQLDHIYIAGYFNSSTATFNTSTISNSGAIDAFTASYNAAQWPIRAGGNTDDYVNDLAVDNSGNTYITGVFTGSAVFGTQTIYSLGYGNTYIAKYNSSGTYEWVHQGGNSGVCGDVIGRSIAVDGSGNSYIGGDYSASATFGSTTLPATSGCLGGGFLCKYDNTGAIQWAVKAAGGDCHIYGITCDASSNIYITGAYYGSATIGTSSFTSAGSSDIFVAEFNSSGTFLWAGSYGGTGQDGGHGITTDGTNVFITGQIVGTVTFGSYSAVGSGLGDVVIAKFSSAGTPLAATAAGSSTDGDIGNDISIDNLGNVYVTGSFGGTGTFGTTSLTSAGYSDVFVCKYVGSLAVCSWARKGGGAAGSEEGAAIQWTNSGLFVTGTTLGSGSFGIFSYSGLTLGDVFFVRYLAPTGVEQYFVQMGGSGIDGGKGVGRDGEGSAYVAGNFTGTGTFGSASLSSTYPTTSDIFIEKFNGADGTAARMGNTETAAAIPAANGFTVYPNPGNGLFTIETPAGENKDVFIYDLTGQLVFSKTQIGESTIPVDISLLPKGLYLLKVQSAGDSQTFRIIKQ